MLKSTAIAFTLVLAPLPALAYTQADADACTQDAFRLCQAAIPDEGRVAHCLAQNKRKLSPACKIVFSRPNTARASTRSNSSRSSGSHDLY
jgi:hypothetical protein